ncbi:hypothetical protein QBC37DRAFT_391445 [Rhypophila decipiens]|uniref:Uncharacterized protein n=1 Tax=Rhypophila decipiens TaxID=261697 RepID=A0AAN6XYT1_9PEZI|nr:hypothetical protein QBC37DRAFT_391445 [Rhypophila decipiens]
MALLTFFTVAVSLWTCMVSGSPSARQDTRRSPKYIPGPYGEVLKDISFSPDGVFVLGIDGVLRTFTADHTVVDYRQLDAEQVQQMTEALAKQTKGVHGDVAPSLSYLAEHPEVDGRLVEDTQALLAPTDPLNLPSANYAPGSSPAVAPREQFTKLLEERQRPCGRTCESLADCRPIGCYACYYPGGPGNWALCFQN